MSEVPIRRRKLSDYHKDRHNANRGSKRGQRSIAESFERNGAGRSLLADKDGDLIAGNQAIDGAAAAGIQEVIEVTARPDQLVVVRREDLDLDSDDPEVRARSRDMAYADNRAADFHEYDAAVIGADLDAGLDLEVWFRDDELDDILAAADVDAAVGAAVTKGVEGDRLKGERRKQIKPVLYLDEVQTFERALRATGLDNRGQAVLAICQYYLAEKGEGDGEVS